MSRTKVFVNRGFACFVGAYALLAFSAMAQREMYPLKEGIVQPLHCDAIGTKFDASAKYIYRKLFVANAGVGHLFPGYG